MVKRTKSELSQNCSLLGRVECSSLCLLFLLIYMTLFTKTAILIFQIILNRVNFLLELKIHVQNKLLHKQLRNSPVDIPYSYNIKAKRKYFKVKLHVK